HGVGRERDDAIFVEGFAEGAFGRNGSVMITRPLDLQSRLKPPSKRLNPLPLFDVLLIAFFFSLFSSSFVLSPGLTINLPEGGSGPGLPATAVLTVHSDDMLLFEGRILNMSGLAEALRDHASGPG